MTSIKLENCRICGSKNIKFDKELLSEQANKTCTFYVCNDCGTIMDSGNFTPDYSSEEEAASFNLKHIIKCYAESGAGLFFIGLQLQLLKILLRYNFNQASLKYLDIGAGFGFSLHMAKYFGWDALGIEPSLMGKIGGERLGVQIIPTTLENSDIPECSFDVISSSEVIEHVQDPDAFIQNLARYLVPKGILLLTTPNADAAFPGETIENEWLESYGPGFHYNIFSPRSIKMVLARNGFTENSILLSEGSSNQKRMIIIATKEQGILPVNIDWSLIQVQTKIFVIQYLKSVITARENNKQKDEIYSGSVYRLFEILISDGNFEDSKEYMDKLEDIINNTQLNQNLLVNFQVDSLEEYLKQAPSYLGKYYFYKGIYALNYTKEYREAVHLFEISTHLCKLEKNIGLYHADPHRYSRAKLHEGLALLYDGKQSDAIKIFDALLAQPDKVPVDVLETLYLNNGIAYLQLRENNKAISYFTELLIKKYPEYPKPASHIMLALNQSVDDLHNNIDGLHNDLNSKINLLTEKYNKDKVFLLQKLDKYESFLLQKIDKYEAVLNKIIEQFNRINRLLDYVVLAPKIITRNLFKPRSTTISQDGLEITVGEIISGSFIEQQITSTENNLSQIRLKIGTFQRLNTSQLYVEILDESKNQLRYIEKNTSLFGDNTLHTLSFEPIPDSRGKKYWIRVSSMAVTGNAVTLWCNRKNCQGQFIINGKKRSNSLIYELGYVDSTATNVAGLKDILIITPDKLGKIRIGLGMRHWEIAKALSSQGLKVSLATPYPIPLDIKGEGFELHSALSSQTVLNVAQDHKCVMVQGDVLLRYPTLEASNERIIVDMVTPFHIEDIEKGQKEFEHGYNVIRKCLLRGDFFVCGNEWQRVYWLGMLTSLGRINKQVRDENAAFYSLIDVAGFGIPDEPPLKSRPVLKGVFSNIVQDDFVLMWMGGIWDWLDPLTLIQGVHEAHQVDERVKLFFPAYRQSNGNPSLMAQKAKNLCIEIGALDKSVFFNEYPVPYEERGNYLLESDSGVVCQAANFETQISARTRVLDYIWTGLPILINEGDEWCELVRKHNLGIVVSGGSVDEWKNAILKLASDSEARMIKTANIEKIKPQYYWKRVIEPIVKYVNAEVAT